MTVINESMVKKKQPNSKMCFVCGLKNTFGLKARFYEVENKRLIGIFSPAQEHQGYPRRLHGGVASSILDETLGRSVLIDNPDKWWVTMSMKLRFRFPVPLKGPIQVVGRVDNVKGPIYEASGQIILANGKAAVTAKAKFLTQNLHDITQSEDFATEQWFTVDEAEDPLVIHIPEVEK